LFVAVSEVVVVNKKLAVQRIAFSLLFFFVRYAIWNIIIGVRTAKENA